MKDDLNFVLFNLPILQTNQQVANLKRAYHKIMFIIAEKHDWGVKGRFQQNRDHPNNYTGL